MKNNPLFTIVTVCRNSEKTIGRTIESVMNQICTDYEYVIVDGNSDDETNNIIKKKISLFQNRVYYVSEPDKGIYDAMNKGIRSANGSFICFLNADDWFEADTLSKVKKVYEKELSWPDMASPYAVIYGGQRTITNGKEENCVFYHHDFLARNMLCHQACFVSRECFERFGLFDESYQSAADYEFTLRMFLSGEVKFIPIHDILVNFSSGGMNESFTGRRETNLIRYQLGVITKKAYYLEKLKLKASQLTYFILRKKPQKVTI